MLQYVMLYGVEFYTDGVDIRPVEMTMGLVDIVLENHWREGDFYYVQGGPFTDSSQIFVNEDGINTLRMADGALLVEGKEIQVGDIITVCQVSGNGTVLATSNSVEIG